jgi:hypothetical protein
MLARCVVLVIGAILLPVHPIAGIIFVLIAVL